MHDAVRINRFKMIKLLMMYGASLNTRNMVCTQQHPTARRVTDPAQTKDKHTIFICSNASNKWTNFYYSVKLNALSCEVFFVLNKFH